MPYPKVPTDVSQNWFQKSFQKKSHQTNSWNPFWVHEGHRVYRLVMLFNPPQGPHVPGGQGLWSHFVSWCFLHRPLHGCRWVHGLFQQTSKVHRKKKKIDSFKVRFRSFFVDILLMHAYRSYRQQYTIGRSLQCFWRHSLIDHDSSWHYLDWLWLTT